VARKQPEIRAEKRGNRIRKMIRGLIFRPKKWSRRGMSMAEKLGEFDRLASLEAHQ
jgi:hypothetical protein